ncbi:MAG: HAD-IIA family hydrolase [Clostridiales bacterium]|nr:HAD-IIA family hydrolase [Clostridiales bacterium]
MDSNNYYTSLSDSDLSLTCSRIRHVALDMDGTIYLGSNLFPWTIGFLNQLRDNGISFSFLTNNPTKSVNDYVAKLAAMGIEARPEEIYTTAVATIDYIKLNHPGAKHLFVLGTPSMTSEFEEAGFTMSADDPDDRPDLLVVAFDMTLTYERLCRAAWWAAQGIPYIATNPDRVCPTDKQVILVDCGSMTECIFHATGRRPDIVIGKPNPDMLRCIMAKRGLQPYEVAMCGDRIYTDVATARNAGALGVLVLSGETTLDTALNNDPVPVLITDNVATFGNLLANSAGKHV